MLWLILWLILVGFAWCLCGISDGPIRLREPVEKTPPSTIGPRPIGPSTGSRRIP